MIQTQVIGNIGAVAKKAHNGTSLFEFSVASNDRDKNTTWINCTLWGREKLEPYLTKGTKVFVSGELKLETYIKNNGEKGSSLKLTASTIELLSSTKTQQEDTDTQPPF